MKIDPARPRESIMRNIPSGAGASQAPDIFGEDSFKKNDSAPGLTLDASEALRVMNKSGECGLRAKAFFQCGEALSMHVNRDMNVAYIDLRGGFGGTFYDFTKGTLSSAWVGSASRKVPVGPNGQLYGSERLSIGIKAFDADTGKEKWSFNPGYTGLFHSGIYVAAISQDGSPLAIGNTQLQGSSYKNEMMALDQDTGALRWKIDLGDGYDITPVQVGRNTLITDRKVGKDNPTILGLDSRTGKVRWKEKLGYPLSSQAPVVKDGAGKVLVAGQGRIFEFDEKGLKRAIELEGSGDCFMQSLEIRPDLGDNLLLASTYRHGFFTIDRATGKVITTYPDASASGTFHRGKEGLVYATHESSGHHIIVVMDEKSGKKRWDHQAEFVEIESIGVSPGGDIYKSNSAGPITRLDPGTGKPTELFSIDVEKYGAPKRILAFSDDSGAMFLSTEKGIMLVDMRELSAILKEHPESLAHDNGSEKIVMDDDHIFIDGVRLDVHKWNKCSL
jgi:outer membrane protein assembly factor BamB